MRTERIGIGLSPVSHKFTRAGKDARGTTMATELRDKLIKYKTEKDLKEFCAQIPDAEF